MQKLLNIAAGSCGLGKRQRLSHCYIHGTFCPVDPPVEAEDIWLEGGGTPCVAFSPQGARGEWLHATSLPTSCWFGATAAARHTIVFHECSRLFTAAPAFEQSFPASKGFRVATLQVSAQDVGLPMTRPRAFTLVYDAEKLESSVGLTKDVFATVKKAFSLSSESVSGHDFWFAPRVVVNAYLQAAAFSVGHVPESADELGRCALASGNKVRLFEYEKQFQLMFEGKTMPSDGNMPIIDLSQNFKVRSNLKSQIPSLLCGSTIWSMLHRRPLLPSEYFVLMGWPVPGLSSEFSDCEHTFPFPAEVFQFMKDSDSKRLTGNAMQCRLLGVYLSMVLAILKKVPTV